MSAVATPVAPPRTNPSAPTIVTHPERIVVVVTQDDIRNGRRRAPLSCAVALAANRRIATDGDQYASMESDGTLVVITEGQGGDAEFVPYFNDDAGRWVRRFDRNKGMVSPERFVFRLVRPWPISPSLQSAKTA